MATEQLVLSTLTLRLQQCDALVQWLHAKHPEQASLQRASEALRRVGLIVADTLSESC